MPSAARSRRLTACQRSSSVEKRGELSFALMVKDNIALLLQNRTDHGKGPSLSSNLGCTRLASTPLLALKSKIGPPPGIWEPMRERRRKNPAESSAIAGGASQSLRIS